MSIRTVIFDLDGVVRHFAPCDEIEARYGLEPGTLHRLPYEPDIIEPTVTGVWSYEQWIEAVGARLAERFGDETRVAAHEFTGVGVTLDEEVIDLVRRLRKCHTVAVLTNGTTRVEEELRALEVDEEFDHIFNSARIGYAKPDVRVFEHVVRAVGCEPGACVFTDDSEFKLTGAAELGMHTIHFTGAPALEAQLQRLGARC